MGRRASAAIALALSLCATSGCDDKSAEISVNATKVTVSSANDATQAVADDTRGFRLSWPGAGWKLLNADEARQVSPQAAAGLLSHRGITALVIVRAVAKPDLGQHVAELIDRMALTDPQVERNESESFAGQPARRFFVRGEFEGASLRYAGLVVSHRGQVYRLMAWGAELETTADGSWFDPVVSAFSLTDGSAPRAAASQPKAAARGVGWRIVEGAFESAPARLRVRPADRWRLVVGEPLARLDGAAEIGLVHDDLDLTLLFRAEPVPGTRQAGFAERASRQLREELKPTAEPEREPATIAGKKLQLVRFLVPGHSYRLGAWCDGSLCITVQATASQTDDAKTALALAAAWQGVELLSAGAAAKLAQELGAGADGSRAVGRDFAIGAGEFRSFRWRLAWKRPSGRWRLAAGARARAVNQDALLYVHEPFSGLHGLIIAESAAGAALADYHEQVIARLQALVGFPRVAAEQTAVDQVPALVSSGEAGPADRRLRYRVLTTVHDGRAVQLMVWARPALMAQHAEQAAAATAGLVLKNVPAATQQRAHTYRDARLGFEIQPPSGWEQRDLTPPVLSERGTFVRWGRDGRWLGVIAASLLEPPLDAEWFVGYLEQLIRDELGPISRGAVADTGRVLATQPARHITWIGWQQRVDALVSRRGHTIYALLTVDADDETFNLASQRFVLLP